MTRTPLTRLILTIATLSIATLASCTRKQENDGAASTAPTGEPCDNWISGKEARKIVTGGGILLDVRTPAEFSLGHLEGSVNIEVDAVSTRLSELPRDKQVVVYCRSGKRAHRAALLLKDEGYAVSEIGTQAQYESDAPAGCP